jgi:glutathione S-transferase
VKLYECPSSPHCLKVRAVAYELEVELEGILVNIFQGAARSPGFEALNPNGLVPVLVDGEFVLWESNAILTYLASAHGGGALSSADPRERADVDRWLHWQSAHLGPAISAVAFERLVKPIALRAPVDCAAAAAAARDFRAHCRVLEAALQHHDHVANRLSVADFALACVLYTAARVNLGVEAFPRTAAWLQRMLSRDSVARALVQARGSISAMYAGRTDTANQDS